MNHDEYYDSTHPLDDVRVFPCTCRGPPIHARITVTNALLDMHKRNPTPLPSTVTPLPMMLRHVTVGCACLKEYFSITNQLLQAINERNDATEEQFTVRNDATEEQFTVRNQRVRDVLYYFSGQFLEK